MTFYDKLRHRLVSDVDTLRGEINAAIQLDKLLDVDLSEINAYVNNIKIVLKRSAVNQAKRVESKEVLEDAVNRLADSATIAANIETLNKEPANIKAMLVNAPETNLKIAVKLLEPEQRRRLVELLNDD